MVFSITQNPYSYSINPLLSLAVCSFSALKISHLFANQVHLLNLSKEQAQRAKKIFLVVVQISAVISVVYPTGSAVGFIALYIVSIAASRYFQTLTPPAVPMEEKDPLVRFKMLDDLAKSKPMQHLTLQTEKAKIINDHPEISTLSYFESFDEMIQFAKTYEVSKLNLSGTPLSSDQMDILTSQLPNLTYLNVANCRIKNPDLRKITSRLTKLTNLNISSANSRFTSDALKTIASLEHLTHLDISRTETDSPAFQSLATQLKKLTHLNISHCGNITSSDIQALTTHLTNLTYLDISGCDVNDATLQAITTNLITLTHLDINYCTKVSSVGIQSLKALTNLSWLNLCLCDDVDNESLKIIAQHLKKLTHLDLGYCRKITSEGIQSLRTLTNLSWLNLSNCEFDDQSLKIIAQDLKKLTHLILVGCKGVNDLSLKVIATDFKELIHLDISSCSEMTSTGIESLKNLSNLSQLKLSCCPTIDDTSLRTIAQNLKKLTHLDLSYCLELTSVGIQSLKDLSNLSRLSLSRCKVGDQSVQTIAEHLKKLTYLDLSHCSQMTSVGIQSLKNLSNLSWLDISHCTAVDDPSLQTIAEHLKKLTYLDISSCNDVTLAALEYFKKIKVFHTIR